MPAVPATIHNELTRLLLILLLVSSTSEGQAADRFVSTAGSDAANNCLSSVSPCLTVANGLAQAASGDSVKVAGGNYRENVTISTATTLTLAGGWTADFSAQDPAAMSTVLLAAMQLPVVTILARSPSEKARRCWPKLRRHRLEGLRQNVGTPEMRVADCRRTAWG